MLWGPELASYSEGSTPKHKGDSRHLGIHGSSLANPLQVGFVHPGELMKHIEELIPKAIDLIIGPECLGTEYIVLKPKLILPEQDSPTDPGLPLGPEIVPDDRIVEYQHPAPHDKEVPTRVPTQNTSRHIIRQARNHTLCVISHRPELLVVATGDARNELFVLGLEEVHVHHYGFVDEIHR